jgi:hypothetical protein
LIETQEITFEDVLRAGRILFGPAFIAEAAGWRDDLRSAYRRRALETHPDRARALGRAERELIREFAAVSDAYRLLSCLRAGPLPRGTVQGPPPRPPWRPPHAARRPAPRPAEPRATAPRQPAPHPQGFTAGPRVRVGVRPQDLPRRRLRFAEYLYYSGRVRWTELAEAIAWQRAQRPALGRIAVEFGFLEPDDVGMLLERRREAGAAGVPFGEWAVRQGYLTPFQLLATLGQQLRLQRPIGQFFVERGLIDAGDIDLVRRRILRHNARFWSPVSAPPPAR